MRKVPFGLSNLEGKWNFEPLTRTGVSPVTTQMRSRNNSELISASENTRAPRRRDSDQVSGRDLRFRLPLSFVEAVVLKPTAALEHGNALAESLLEFGRAMQVLIQSLWTIDAFSAGRKRFCKKDCGEYLHRCSLRWSHNFGSTPPLSW
jgi:hypothetical protein